MTSTQRTLFWVQTLVLSGATVFAWVNWTRLYLKICVTCTLAGEASPWTAPCFFGAIAFTLALVLHIALFVHTKKATATS